MMKSMLTEISLEHLKTNQYKLCRPWNILYSHEWQASMEFLLFSSVGEVSCNGFADCLQTSVDELQRLISLMLSVSLLPSLPMAVNSLLELVFSSNTLINEHWIDSPASQSPTLTHVYMPLTTNGVTNLQLWWFSIMWPSCDYHLTTTCCFTFISIILHLLSHKLFV